MPTPTKAIDPFASSNDVSGLPGYSQAVIRDREAPLQLAMRQMDDAVLRLGQNLEAVAKRLEPVMGPDHPAKADGGPVVGSLHGPLAGSIMAHADTINGRAAWLESILERLDLP